MEEKQNIDTIDQYIAQFPPEIRSRLESIRTVVRETAPEASEKISYNMPTFTLNGNLVHFAAHKSHIGFYPTPSGIEKFKEKLKAYHYSKGSVQFPNDKPLPLDLVKDIVSFRVSENKK
jgi:uncharacterized protein YdhG (YjbR/CyaY superfamily)